MITTLILDWGEIRNTKLYAIIMSMEFRLYEAKQLQTGGQGMFSEHKMMSCGMFCLAVYFYLNIWKFLVSMIV